MEYPRLQEILQVMQRHSFNSRVGSYVRAMNVVKV